MKIIILLLSLLAFIRSDENSGRKIPSFTQIIILNSPKSYPLAIDEPKLFWAGKKYFDTVSITGSNLNSLFSEQINNLKYDPSLNGINIQVAIVRYYDDKKDTIYGSPNLKFWRVDNKYFSDSSNCLKNILEHFLL